MQISQVRLTLGLCQPVHQVLVSVRLHGGCRPAEGDVKRTGDYMDWAGVGAPQKSRRASAILWVF
jgi:hypothetical protein